MAAATTATGLGLDVSLSKIRHHTGSKLANQRAPAQLLSAIESTLGDASGTSRDGGQTTPTAYLMALIAMLEKAASTTQEKKGAKANKATLLPSTFYLLTLVTPHVAPGVLRAQLSSLIEPLADVLSAAAVPLGEADSQAAVLRSAMGILEALLLALATDRATLSTDLQLRGCWNSTLRLCLDARPKVRKRAQELVGRVLQTDAPLTTTTTNAKPHPFAAKTAEWATAALTDVASAGGVAGPQSAAPVYDVKHGRAKQPEVAAAARQKQIDGGSANSGIWICGFLRTLAPVLPPKSIAALTTNLLRVISQNNPFLSTAAFEVFESLFKIYRPVPAVASTFGVLETRPSALPRAVNAEALIATLDALCSTSVMPNNTDVQLVPPYLRAVENAMVAFARIDDGKPAWKRFTGLWSQLNTLAFSSGSKASRDSTAVRQAGRDAMCAMVRYCLPDAAIEQALQANEKGKLANDPLGKFIGFFEQAFDKQALRYSHAWPELFSVLAALVQRLRYRRTTTSVQRADPAASTLLMPLVAAVGQLRTQPKFDHRESADAVIGAAVQVCGPAAVLQKLPLGLLGENGQEQGRGWLLPLMRTHISNTSLGHFVDTMVPLSEALFNKQAECEQVGENGKAHAPIQAKVYEAMTEQIWALLPGYCDVPTDMLEALSQSFVELLANVLYSQPTLRPSVCRALQVLVDRSQSLAKSAAPAETLRDTFGLTAEQGRAYVERLTAVAPTLLAVFFNVFSQSLGEARGYLADCMVAYLAIMTHDEIAKTYEKIVRTLDEALPALDGVKASGNSGPKGVPAIPHTMMDLLILLVPFLTQREADKLFDLGCQDRLLASRDASMQKKTYRVLARLMEGARGAQVLGVGPDQAGKLPVVLAKLQATTGSVVVGAKRDRTALLASIMPLIPSTELHILPAIVPEAVLATKEVNQGARELAYTLLVEMGRKMSAGGTIKRHLVDGTDEEAAAAADATMNDGTNASSVVTANIQEYITMVAAGLAGTSPHMISATITALARLMYEFHADLSRETLDDMVSTMDVFLSSPNREVAKSALGFVKVAIVSLPSEVVEANLKTIVHALFASTNHHRVHFKSKIRHIVERLLRRYGYDRIAALTDEDNRKLLVNIRKRKERSRRKKAAKEDGQDGDEEGEDGQETAAPATMGQRTLKNVGADAFEEAIYGSESDMSDDSDEDDNDEAAGHAAQRNASGKRAGRKSGDKRQQAIEQDYLLQDDDQPMDLLDRAALASGGRVTTTGGAQPQQSRKRQPGQEAKKFTLDEETGRMVIDDEDGDDDEGGGAQAIDVDGAGRAYVDRERGTHGLFSKGGVVQINKNNKRNRAADEEMEQEQMALEDELASLQQQAAAAATASAADKKRTKQQQQQQAKKTIGSEFRARKAGGDIKRGETTPFAYVPLSQVGSKRGGGGGEKRGEMRFLGKDKKRRM